MSDIKKQLTSGIFYTAVAKYTGVIISITITGILARLLTPEDYGTIVPITVLITFFTILGDIGIGPAIIQSNDLSKKEINTLFTFTILTGAILSILFFLSSWIIANIYNSKIFVILCQLLSLSLFFSCANIVTNALLYKAKLFKFLAIRSLLVQIIAGGIAILSAYRGAGLYALVIQSIISSICLFIISYSKNHLQLCPTKMEWSALKKIKEFSIYQFLFNISNYFSVNLDKLLINKFIGTTQLGYYDKSYKLMQMPLQNIPFIITPVMHPIFSEMQNNLEKMCVYYSKVVRFLAFIGFPLSIFLYFAGQDLIYFIFGQQWTASIPSFKILALSVGFQTIIFTSGSIFQSAGKTNLLFISGILSTISILIATLTGLLIFGTIEAISILLLCAFITNFFQTYSIMFCHLFKVNIIIFIRNLISPFILTIILAIILFSLSFLVNQFNTIVSLLTKGSLWILVSLTYIQLTGEYDLIPKIKKLKNIFNKNI